MPTNIHITKPEKVHLPISVKGALAQDKLKLMSAGTMMKIFGEHQVGACLHISSNQATYHTGGESISTIDLSDDLSDEAKLEMIKSAVKYLNPALMNKAPKKKLGKKVVKPIILGVDMAHDEIAAEVGNGGITSLPKAKTFYDPVTSSSAGSRYVYIAKLKDGKAKLAVRLKGTAVSVRIEPFNSDLQSLADVLGLSNNGHYASGHFQAADTTLLRYMNLLTGSLLGTWEIAQFNEKKIREIGA